MSIKSISSQTRCIILATAATLGFSNFVPAAASAGNSTTATAAPENSAANSETGITAQEVGNSESEAILAAKIRQTLVREKDSPPMLIT